MAVFKRAEGDEDVILQRVMKAHHPDLMKYEVTVCLLFASVEKEEDGAVLAPALKSKGMAIEADIRVPSHLYRVAGADDALLLVDKQLWDRWGQTRRKACLDNQLTRLEFVLEDDDEGKPKLDSGFRPRLKVRPWDASIGLFYDVVERYGDDAVGIDAFREVRKEVEYRLNAQL